MMILLAYAFLIIVAAVCIVVGAERSLNSPYSPIEFPDDEEETLSHKEAASFPIAGSCALLGMFLLIKIFGRDFVNAIVTVYFVTFGLLAFFTVLAPTALAKLPPRKDAKPLKFSFTLPWDNGPTSVSLHRSDYLCLFISAALGVWYGATKHWMASNFLGVAFSISAISMLRLQSYAVGAILLCGLFVYDIFWVFYTDVMVTVARSFEAPIKILFPRDILEDEPKLSMLGLGDIVVPGVFLALLLSYRRDTFNAGMVSYVVGLLVTMLVMHFTGAAQPALLYLVPACLAGPVAHAFAKRGWSEGVLPLVFFETEKKKTE